MVAAKDTEQSQYHQVESQPPGESPYSLLDIPGRNEFVDVEDISRRKKDFKTQSPNTNDSRRRRDSASLKQTQGWFTVKNCACVVEKGNYEPESESMAKYNLMFLLVACGYMSSWTAIGSLIPYFKAHYGADFYVEIYCAYYLPGLAVSLLQQRFDVKFDQKVGSWNAYMFRMCFSYSLVILLIVGLPYMPDIPELRIFIMGVIGSFSWLMHGTACMLVSMFPPAACAWLQTGFRCPEIFTVVIIILLNLEAEDPSHKSLVIFHMATAVLLFTGLVGFIVIMFGAPAQHYLQAKDSIHDSSNMEIIPLIEKKLASLKETGAEPAVGEEDKEFIAHAIGHCRASLYLTMFSSIFTAAFFAYVTSTDDNDIEQILYFTRLFCDLFGRPITRLPRPDFIREPHQLMWASVARLGLAVVFFAYIILPGFPQNDTFITFIVGIFSVGSGYLSVLAYEYAALQVKSKAAQSYAATLMNTSFQYAAFSSVVSGVIIAELGFV